MTNSKSILQEAIAEAKQVRETAIQNAYKQLEESLTPSIKAMLEAKLAEEDEVELEGVEAEEQLEEANTYSGFEEVKAPKEEKVVKEAEDEEEKPAEEEEAESEEKEETSAEEEEAPAEEEKESEDEEEKESEDEEEKESAEEDEKDAEEGEEPVSDDTKLEDITLGDLKDILVDIVANAQAAVAPEEGVDMEVADVEGAGEEDAPVADPEIPAVADAEQPEEEESDEIDLSEILKELDEEDEAEAVEQECDMKEAEEKDEVLKELETYKAAVNELSEQLKETNLRNAKLSYTTRLLATKALNESQKAQVIKAFDGASSITEVKSVYKSLGTEFTAPKNVIKEHRGSASKAVGKSTLCESKNIIDVDPTVIRFQQLAGIIND